MSSYRHTFVTTFVPSSYSQGLQPRKPYDASSDSGFEGYAFGNMLDFLDPSSAVKNYFFGEEEAEPSLLAKYWWVFPLAVPVVYLCVNMALDYVKEKKK